MALPLLDLLEALLAWALRAGLFVIIVSALRSVSVSLPGLNWIWHRIRNGLEGLLHNLAADTAKWALAAEGVTTAALYQVAARIEQQAWAGWLTAKRTLEAFEILMGTTLPALLRPLEAGIAALPRVIRVPVRKAEHAEAVAQKAIAHAVAVTVPRALPWVDREAQDAKATAERALRGLKGIRNLLAAGVLGGLIIKTLTRAGTGNIYCRNLREVNRHVCGADPHLLDTLLGGLTLIIGTVSLLEFAKACQTVQGEIAAGVQSFLRP